MRRSSWNAVVLGICLAYAGATSHAGQIDAGSWTPDKQELVREQSELASITKGLQSDSPSLRADQLGETWPGVRSVAMCAHAFEAPEMAALKAANQEVESREQLMREAATRYATQSEQYAFVSSQLPHAKNAQVSATLRASTQGPVGSGGFVYAYTTSGSYHGFSSIAADGRVTLPASDSQELVLYAFPNPPFAIQVVTGVQLRDAGTIALRDARRVPIDIRNDLGRPVANLVAGLSVDIDGDRFGPWELDVNIDANAPALWLAEGHRYELQLFAAPPLLFDRTGSVAASSTSVAAEARLGAVLDVSFEASPGLVSGCALFAFPRLVSYSPTNNGRRLALPQLIRSAVNQPTGFRIAVPRGRATTLSVNFGTGTGVCSIADHFLPGLRMRRDAPLAMTLRPRPIPRPELVASSGERISHTTTLYALPEYGSTALIRTKAPYEMVFNPSVPTFPVSLRLFGTDGPFKVRATTERLGEVNVTLAPQAGVVDVSGLMEVRRGNQLLAAFELLSSRASKLQLPAGPLNLSLVGLRGTYRNADGSQGLILLRPRTMSLTGGIESPRSIEFQVGLPAAGLSLRNLVRQPLPLKLEVIEGGDVQSIGLLQVWHGGLRTDWSPLDVFVTGAGYSRARMSFNPTPDLPMVEIPVAADAPVYRGTLRGSDGVALAGRSILNQGPEGDWTYGYTTGADGRFSVPLVPGAHLVFSPPPGGTDLMRVESVPAEARSVDADVVLESLPGLSVPSASGPPLQLLYGSGSSAYRIVFVAESYTRARESFTDLNANGVWDGRLFLDLNADGLWQTNEPVSRYGNAPAPASSQAGTDITTGNEPFVDTNSDGYPNIDDYAVFIQNARNYLRALVGTPEIRSGITFDAYVLFLDSEQAGMDVIAADGAMRLQRNTRFGASLELGRFLLGIGSSNVVAEIAKHIDRWNLQVVLINQPVFAGRANSFILSNGGLSAQPPHDLVAGHEFGHNPGGLLDEYDEFSGSSVAWVNPAVGHLSHRVDRSMVPWRDNVELLAGRAISLPGSPGVGVFAGAMYQAGGVYRSTNNSRMRFNAVRFNAASIRRMRQSFCLAQLQESQLQVEPSSQGPAIEFVTNPCLAPVP
jgi:hypothetical protein